MTPAETASTLRLFDAINAAAALMASAPAWHAMHREAIAELRRVKNGVES